MIFKHMGFYMLGWSIQAFRYDVIIVYSIDIAVLLIVGSCYIQIVCKPIARIHKSIIFFNYIVVLIYDIYIDEFIIDNPE